MKQHTAQNFHNPEKLTRQQVGDKYRLLLPEEVDGRFGKGSVKCETLHKWDGWLSSSHEEPSWTYRIPLATPLPDGTVLTSIECCFAEESAQV